MSETSQGATPPQEKRNPFCDIPGCDCQNGPPIPRCDECKAALPHHTLTCSRYERKPEAYTATVVMAPASASRGSTAQSARIVRDYADAVVQRVSDLNPGDYPDADSDTLRVSLADLRLIVEEEAVAFSRGETPPRDAPTPCDSATYGELPAEIRALVVNYEWDNMTRAQQRTWLIAALSASQRAREESRDDAERYRFLRDNPLQLRAIDGNAGFHGQWSAEHFDRFTDAAREDAARAAQPEGPANG